MNIKCPTCGARLKLDGAVENGTMTNTLICPNCGPFITVKQDVAEMEKALEFFESQPKGRLVVFINNVKELLVLKATVKELQDVSTARILQDIKQAGMVWRSQVEFVAPLEMTATGLQMSGLKAEVERM